MIPQVSLGFQADSPLSLKKRPQQHLRYHRGLFYLPIANYLGKSSSAGGSYILHTDHSVSTRVEYETDRFFLEYGRELGTY